MKGVIWFREDLRLEDNSALNNATKNCDEGIAAIYILDQSLWQKHHMAKVRQSFFLNGVIALKDALAKANIHLYIIAVDKTAHIPKILTNILIDNHCDSLFFNRQYEANELVRDAAMTKLLEKNNIDVHAFDDQSIMPPDAIKKDNGEYFKVFTAYKRVWLKRFAELKPRCLPKPKAKKSVRLKGLNEVNLTAQTNNIIDLWPAGEYQANRRLNKFIQHRIEDYEKHRNFPAIEGTSRLSPYLAAGMISPRVCFYAALEANQQELYSGKKGILTWMSELIWRDFYKSILYAHPHVSKHQPYQVATKNIPWLHHPKQFEQWQAGQTGYPLIDAAMRQLQQTGWMHNRLRMIVAMFLVKNLFLDWRLGEAYFAEHLIDCDLSANNGGWQWSASTGTDASPYFRIFNPLRQSERFDPEGEFIKKFCPELKHLDKKAIHEPYKYAPELAKQAGYPKPMIDLNENRQLVLSSFKNLKSSS